LFAENLQRKGNQEKKRGSAEKKNFGEKTLKGSNFTRMTKALRRLRTVTGVRTYARGEKWP